MQGVIETVVASQPPVWRIGIMTAQKFLAALVKSEQVPVKAIGSMLLSFFALIKLEGYASGILELQTNVIKALNENKDASPEQLVAVLREALEIEHTKLTKNAGSLYMTTLGAMIRQTASMPVDAAGLDGASSTFNAFTEAVLEEHKE